VVGVRREVEQQCDAARAPAPAAATGSDAQRKGERRERRPGALYQ
jgi:hypothetical protein